MPSQIRTGDDEKLLLGCGTQRTLRIEVTNSFLNASWSGSVIVADSGNHRLWPS